MFRFRLEVAGESLMDRGIGRFADGVSDYRPIWPVIEDDFYAHMAERFKSEGAKGGGERWQELSAEYAGWKEARFPGKPILQRSGDLMRSLTSGNDPNAVKREERRTLTLGSKVPYGIYHQSPAPRRRLPRRPPMLVDAAFKRGVMRHLQAYVVQVATQSGFRRGLTPIESARLGAKFGRGIPPRRTQF